MLEYFRFFTFIDLIGHIKLLISVCHDNYVLPENGNKDRFKINLKFRDSVD